MLIKFISLIMSFVMAVTGFLTTCVSNVVDTLSEWIYGVPFTEEAVKSDFFAEIDEEDIVKLDDESGFIKDKIAVFIGSDMSFSEKIEFFASCGGLLVGWCAPADLYIISYPAMTYERAVLKCEQLNKIDGVELSIPVMTFRTDLDMTPADDFNMEDSEIIWDELLPEGNNWWLEAIEARSAWDYSGYYNSVDIGIVDSGYDLTHPELEGKISFPNDRQAGRNRPDLHGTHVAGIISANHNGAGIAGICDNADLICVDWTPEGFQFWSTDIAIFFGISTLVKAGAKVINLSLGTSGSKATNSTGFFERVFSAAALSYMMASLLSKGYDFVAVQSAGNGDFEGDSINAVNNGHFANLTENNIFVGSKNVSKQDILDRIMIVSSVTNNGDGTYTQSDFSNVGSTVDLAAPGDNIYSLAVNGEYTNLSGTSMAAPVVTAVSSLVWSVNPSFTGAQVKEIVCSSYSKVAEINDGVSYFYTNLEFEEYPIVNAKLAVEEAIRRTDSTVGTVKGRIIGEAEKIVFNGNSYTVYSDGSYSFVAPESISTAEIYDADDNFIGSFELTVTAGQTTLVEDYTIETIL